VDKKECVEGLKIIGWDLHHILDCNCANCKALQFAIDNLQEQPREDDIFINHIRSHLSEGQEVVCKICGKTVKEIIDESKKETS